jgi:OOP family OmpA-OmpF porin
MKLFKYLLLPLLVVSSLYSKKELNEYLIQVSPTATYGVPYESFGDSYVGAGGKLRVWNIEADVNFYENGKQYYFLNYVHDFRDKRKRWIPYGLGGFTFLDGEWKRPVSQVGAGLRYRFMSNLSLFSEAKFLCDIKPDKAYYHFTAGVTFHLFEKKRKVKKVKRKPKPKPVVVAPKDSDKDGIEDMLDNCPNSLPNIEVDKVGCALDSDSDGVPNYADKCGATEFGSKVDSDGCKVVPPAPPVDEVKEVQKIAESIAVRFENMSRDIDDKFKPELIKVADFLLSNSGFKAVIEGYTDSLGSAELNQRLSDTRANIVYDFFKEMGVSSDQLSAKGYGESNFIGDNATSEGRYLNRRVTVQVEEK